MSVANRVRAGCCVSQSRNRTRYSWGQRALAAWAMCSTRRRRRPRKVLFAPESRICVRMPSASGEDHSFSDEDIAYADVSVFGSELRSRRRKATGGAHFSFGRRLYVTSVRSDGLKTFTLCVFGVV